MEVVIVSNNGDSTFDSIGEASESFCRRVFNRAHRPPDFVGQNNNNKNTTNEEFSSTFSDILLPTESYNRSVFRRTGHPPSVVEREDIDNEDSTSISDILQPTEQSFQRIIKQTGRLPPHVVSELGSSRNADSSEIDDTRCTAEGSDSFRTTYLKKLGGNVLTHAKEHSKSSDTELDSEQSDKEAGPTVIKKSISASKERSQSQVQFQSSNQKLTKTSAAKKRSKSPDTELSDSEQSDKKVDPFVAEKSISASKKRSQMQFRSTKRKSNRIFAAKKPSKSTDNRKVDPKVAAEPISASKERSQMQLQSPKRTSNRTSAGNKRSKSPDRDLSYSEQLDTEVEPPVVAEPIPASKERSQMQLRSPKRKSNRTSVAKKRSKSPDTELSELEQSDKEVAPTPTVMPKPISASTPKAVRAKPKTVSLDEQLAKFQGNANMIPKVKIDSYLRCLGLSISDKKLQAVTKTSNLYIEKLLDQLCSSTENALGAFSFSELEAGLQIEKLLSERSNTLAFEITSTFTPDQLRRMDGILIPKFNEDDTYFD